VPPGAEAQAEEQAQPPRKKKRGFGLGDLLQGAIPMPH
jgi:hypothetical protein